MVLDKMRTREFIILTLEDTSDWNNATTRKTVMQVGWQWGGWMAGQGRGPQESGARSCDLLAHANEPT